VPANEVGSLAADQCAVVRSVSRASYFILSLTDAEVEVDGRRAYVVLGPDLAEQRGFATFMRRKWLKLAEVIALWVGGFALLRIQRRKARSSGH